MVRLAAAGLVFAGVIAVPLLAAAWSEPVFDRLAQAGGNEQLPGGVENKPSNSGPANMYETVPGSPYEQPHMTLEQQEIQSRNSGASQEVNRNLNSEFANYSESIGAVAWFTALLASVLLAAKAAWLGIPLVSAVASVIQRGFFRWPNTPLEWINKLAIYIGLADLGWKLLT